MMKKIKFLRLCLMWTVLFCIGNNLYSQCPDDGLFITEFVYDVCNGSDLGDGSAGAAGWGEYIIVTNLTTTTTLDLGGAIIDDAAPPVSGATVPAGVMLGPGDCAILSDNTQAAWEGEYGPITATGCIFVQTSGSWPSLNNGSGGDNIGVTGACNSGPYTDLVGDGEAVVWDEMTSAFTAGPVVSIHPDCAVAPVCPDLTAITATDMEVVVVESTCTVAGGTPAGGSIAAPTGTCPMGSTLEYSINGGTTWEATLPTYDQENAVTVDARCACDTDATMVSAMGSVTTVPGMCPAPMCDAAIAAATAPAVVIDSESACTPATGALEGGAISVPTGTCPMGSTLNYSLDGGATWSTTLPVYDQAASITVTTGCLCDIDVSVVSMTTDVVTTPGEACPPAVNNVCDCGADPTPYTINVVAVGGPMGYDLLYVLVDNDAGDAVLANNTTGSFPALADNTNYTVYAFNVLTADVAGFTGALPATIAAGDPILMGMAPFDAFCYEQSEVSFNEDCACNACDEAAVMSANAPPVVIISEAGCDLTTFTAIVGEVGPATDTCPENSTLEYSIDAGATWTTTYTDNYDQTAPVTILTRCTCDSNAAVSSPETSVTTAPGEACPPMVNNVCDCSAAPTPYTINVSALGGPDGYDLLYVLVDNDNGNTVLANNTTGSFPALADNTNYTVYAFNILTADVAGFTGDLPATIAAGDAVLTAAAPFDAYCYEQAEVSFNESCMCDTCPDLTGIMTGDLNVGVTESTCDTPGGTPDGGAVTAPTTACPMGSTLEYSIDAGANWSATLPVYDQTSAITIDTRCTCDSDPTTISAVSSVTTVPGECPLCDDAAITGATAPPVVIIAEAGCDATTFTTTVGAVGPATGTCPVGSTLEYSIDAGATWTTTYTDNYDQTAPVTILTRCICDADPMVVSPETSVTTAPEAPCPPAVNNVCDCSAAPTPYTINVVAVGGPDGYDLLYVLVDNDNGDAVLANNTTGSFPALADNTNYTVYAFNVLTADVAAFTSALPATIAAGDPILTAAAPFDAFCYEQSEVSFNEDCGCVVGCVAVAPVVSNDGGDCNADPDGSGDNTPFVFMEDGTGNATAPYVTEFVVTNGPSGTIVGIFTSLADAQTQANATADTSATGACVQAINFDSTELPALITDINTQLIANTFIDGDLCTGLTDAFGGGIVDIPGLGGNCPGYTSLAEFYTELNTAAGPLALSLAGVETLLGNGAGGQVDIGDLLAGVGGIVVVDVPPFCYATGNEDCITVEPCATMAMCPVAVGPTDGAASICTGGLTTEITDWQTAVTTANPLDATQDPDGWGTIVYSSLADDMSGTWTPDGLLPDGIHNGISPCTPIPQAAFAYLQCTQGTADVTDDTYTLLGTYGLEVWAQPSATPPASPGCTAAVTSACADAVISYSTDGVAFSPIAPSLTPGDADLVVFYQVGLPGAPMGCTSDGQYTLTCPANPVCSITNLTTTPTACDPTDDSYDLVIDFTVTDPGATGMFNVDLCGTAFGPFMYTALPVTITDLTSDGADCDVTVTDVDNVGSGNSIFISELHYDNASTDVNEGVEITAPAGTDLTGYTIVLYNGSNGTTYEPTTDLTGVVADAGSGCGAISFPIAGLQNGAPDGLALVDPTGAVLEFLSYEGVITATNGPAMGMMSTDIGFEETGATLGSESIKLTDAGWMAPSAASFGTVNTGLSCPTGMMTAACEAMSNYTAPTSCVVTTTPEITVDKNDADDMDDTQEVAMGGTATFTIVVTNSGTENLCNITISDPNGLNCEVDVAMAVMGAGDFDADFEPGESFIYTCTVDNVMADFTNTVTVNAEGCDSGTMVMDEDPSDVTVIVPVCSITDLVLTPSACDPVDDTYSLDLNFTVVDSGASGMFNVDLCGTAYGPFMYTDLPVNIPNLTSDASTCDVTVTDVDNAGMPGSTILISELHYDNASTDVNEGVEITAPAGTDLTGYTIVLYNGSNGTTYEPTTDLTGVVADAGSGCGAISFPIAGLQNGAPDGLALVDPTGAVLEFLSYEGVITATNGPAMGMMSTDIGFEETGATLDSESIKLTDAGWTDVSAASFGTINAGLSCPTGMNVGACEATGSYTAPAPCMITLSVFDLALTKVYSGFVDNDLNGVISLGDDITYTVTVYNQGDITATNVSVTDYFTAGELIYVSSMISPTSASPATITDDGVAGYSIDVVPVGSSVSTDVTLTIDPTFTGTDIINYAEITAAFDDNGNIGMDEDSSPGDNQGTDETMTDNDIDDPNGNGNPDNTNDSDDYDPATIALGTNCLPCPTAGLGVDRVCQGNAIYVMDLGTGAPLNDPAAVYTWYLLDASGAWVQVAVVTGVPYYSPQVAGTYTFELTLGGPTCICASQGDFDFTIEEVIDCQDCGN